MEPLEFDDFPFSWEFHHHWRTRHIFQRGRYTTSLRGCLNLMVTTGQKRTACFATLERSQNAEAALSQQKRRTSGGFNHRISNLRGVPLRLDFAPLLIQDFIQKIRRHLLIQYRKLEKLVTNLSPVILLMSTGYGYQVGLGIVHCWPWKQRRTIPGSFKTLLWILL